MPVPVGFSTASLAAHKETASMIDQEEFRAICDDFYKTYLSAKKDLSRVEKIVQRQIIPIEKEFSSDIPTECRSGCAHCCQLRVVAFPHELIAIYLYVKRNLSSERVLEIKSRIRKQFDVVKNFTQDEHFTTNVQCPLLEDNKCSVYPVRPLSCAGYHSMSEAACKDSNEHPEIVGNENGGIPMVAGIKFAQELQVQAALSVLQTIGADAEQYELIRGLNMIFQDSSVNQRWINGRKFQK
jgi:Fe-S-cluster containining protein